MAVKWALTGLLIGTATFFVNSEPCDWLEPIVSDFIYNISCLDTGTVINMWEDCPVDTELFTITDGSISLEPDCQYAYEDTGKIIRLTKQLDAETVESATSCSFSPNSVPTLFFAVLDINEFPPNPARDTTPVMEVNIKENTQAPSEITKIYYTDADLGEAETLTSVLESTGYGSIFTLDEVEYDGGTNIKTFSFKTKEKLDFEDRAFFKVIYQIISKDGKGNETTTDQTFFVYVEDEPDNPPFWSEIVPFYELDECKMEDELFQVTAQDRDVMVDYDIKYSIPEGSDYFQIDESTGMVSRSKPIDREELLELGISSFSLGINATEYKLTGELGETPNTNQQVSIITILDCNDETPEFNNNTYEIEMFEVTAASGNQVIELSIVVKDMDEGDSGTFTLKTDQPDQVSISPKEGKQTQEVTLTALFKADNSLFDYELQQDEPFTIVITAEEKKNTSHSSTANVTITLRDVNDENPVFLQSTYTANVEEGTPLNTHVLTVEANDMDVSPNFGKPSIRYSLESSCNELDIDQQTGNVTLSKVFDFEDTTNGNNNLIECIVTARDGNGTGLENADVTIIQIQVIDVVDEPPRFDVPVDTMEIFENSIEDTPVGNFTVTDADAAASISYEIVQSDCSEGTPGTNVTGWFKVAPVASNPPNFLGQVVVGSSSIDREQCSEVTLNIKATDDNTDAAYQSQSSATESFVITILDENDMAPEVECEGYTDCKGISVDEHNEINPSNASVLVFRVLVSDPDEEDTIVLSLREGGDVMYLSEESVTVEGTVETVEVRTKGTVQIDREKTDFIVVEIVLTDSENHESTQQVTVNVNDLNDKIPVIDRDLCGGEPLEIEEDDGSGDKNGTFVGKIKATDADIESPHNIVRYMMLNDQIPDSKNTWNPFRIDEVTGDVTILLIKGERALDREQFDNWELLFRAYDQCDQSPSCKVLSSTPECKVNIIVKDVNDHSPSQLTYVPDDPIITVDDFLQKDEDIGYTFTAVDEDEGENSTLTFDVVGTYSEGSTNNMNLFRAVDEEFSVDSCRLFSNEDFAGKNYTGTYTVTLKATDGGNRSTEFNITINVEDANDETPYFVFPGCPGENKTNIIRMEENDYKPEENGGIMEVKCGWPEGDNFDITIFDADENYENREVIVDIDRENSTVEDLGDGVNQQTLLEYWTLEPENCFPKCNLKISRMIDREEGTSYNLTLYAKNTADPLKESRSWVRVVVTNVFEDDPYFCRNGNCTQIVYMKENNPDVYAYFYKATDDDNNGAVPGDDEYENVFYYIVGGDKNKFEIETETEEKIVLKNMPDGLDREATAEYTLTILATNDQGEDDIENNGSPRNDTLNLIIRVEDENDVSPVFTNDVIFTSFMESNEMDDRLITIEAVDPDLNETLTYEILNDLQWFETNFVPETSFKLVKKDDRSVNLTMNFDPKGMTQGYCNFTLKVEDAVKHTDTTVVKVYVINEGHQVAMYFSNDVEEVQSRRNEIEEIYSSVYNYACTIDSITPTQDPSGQILANKTTVYMHFIDEEKNEPVDDKIILDLSDSAEVMSQLLRRLDLIGIHLDSIDTYFPPTYSKDPNEKIKELQILLGVVSLVLGLLVILLGTVYFLRTRTLQRKVKVLSTNTFGSKDEGLNKMGLDMTTVPGSNYLAKEHGNHNPVFSESGGLEFKNDGSESISSGDSVLVGVEDNPEFKSYSAKGIEASSSKSFENPTYGYSSDDAATAPPGVVGGMKGNPLLNLSGFNEEPELQVPSMNDQYDGSSMGSQDNRDSLDQNINSNFSFS